MAIETAEANKKDCISGMEGCIAVMKDKDIEIAGLKKSVKHQKRGKWVWKVVAIVAVGYAGYKTVF